MSGPREGEARGATYEQQLAERAAELLPRINLEERLELLAVMDADDMRACLAWFASYAPQLFDFGLVRDRALAERLDARLCGDQDDEPEPYCTACGATVGIFIGHGDAWLHYTGAGTVASPVDLYNAGHAPVIAWRPAAETPMPPVMSAARFEPVPRLQRVPACLVCGVRPVAAPDVVVCAVCDQTGADPTDAR